MVEIGSEGSAADSRVLRNAITRSNGFRIPQGFLTPYHGIRYHLQEGGSGTSAPQNKKEYFNMKHSKARNCIERSFGILKKRWAFL
ncbi:hypothetical protein ACS0TY_011356 [Phlomoides rotata]